MRQVTPSPTWHADMPVDRDTYARWQAAVQEIAPPSDTVSWLYLAWEPGDPWEPVNRWVIWQMRPKRIVRLDILMELNGPRPRSTGHLCTTTSGCPCPLKYGAWRGGAATMIDRAQWDLFNVNPDTRGYYGTRWWVVQGKNGGNLRRFTTIQGKLSRIMGGEDHPPVPGALAYAPVDQRVIDQIAARDRMLHYGMMTDFLSRSGDQLEVEEREATIEAKRRLQAWLKQQIGEVVSEGGRALMRALAGQPRVAGLKDTTRYDEEMAALMGDEDAESKLVIAHR